MIALALAMALQSEPRGFETMWANYGTQLEAEGITRPMFRAAMVWAEGQYHIGRCRAFLRDEQVTHWRNWWDNTALQRSEIGQAILTGGERTYTTGLEDAVGEPLDAVQCQRVADSWMVDMRAAAAAQ